MKTRIKLPRGRPKAEASEQVRQAKQLQEAAKEIQKHKYLIVTTPEHLKQPDRKNPQRTRQEKLDQMLAEHPELRIFRQFMADVFAALGKDQTIEQARVKYQALVSNPAYTDQVNLAKALKHLSVQTFESMMTFLCYENLNRTNNCAERGGRRFRKRQKSHYRLRRTRTLQAWLKADRMQEKQRQEKAPVEPKRLQPRPAEKEKQVA